jgi:hypothetical protein
MVNMAGQSQGDMPRYLDWKEKAKRNFSWAKYWPKLLNTLLGKASQGAARIKSKDKKSKWKDKRGINKLVKKALDRQVKALLSKKATGDDDESEEELEGMKDAHNIRQSAKKKKKSGGN